MKRILIFRDGSRKEITGEAGKYWLTGETRFRKLSKSIAELREEPDESPKKTGASRKRTAKKKTAEE